jgi:hypothetical protein
MILSGTMEWNIENFVETAQKMLKKKLKFTPVLQSKCSICIVWRQTIIKGRVSVQNKENAIKKSIGNKNVYGTCDFHQSVY